MGMFDSVNVTCPNCGEFVEFQSKAGDCVLDCYGEASVPGEIAKDIANDTEECRYCGIEVGVALLIIPASVPVRGVRATV